MFKALRYLKPYLLYVLAVIVLIFGQVQCELSLPDMMSAIVNNGIQFGGITTNMPDALSSDTYEHMQYFLDQDDLKEFTSDYTIGSSVSINKHAYNVDDAYVLKDESLDNKSIEKAFLTVSLLGRKEVLERLNLPEGVDLWQAIQMDPSIPAKISAVVDKEISSYTEENIQAAVKMMTKNEYTLLGIDTEDIQNKYIFNEGLKMLGIALLGSLCAIGAAYCASKSATGAARDMRQDVFKKVESFSTDEFSKFSTASLITRTTNDVQQVQMILTMLLRIVLFAPMMGVTALFKVLRYPELAGILGWTVAGMIVLMIVIFFIALPKFKISQKLVDRLNLVTREQLSGMLVIRAFNNQKIEENRFDKANKDITNLNIFLNRLMAVISPIMTFVMSGVSILIIWIGANTIDAGTMNIGDMMAFLQYATHVLISFMIVAAIFVMIPRSSVSANRIFEVLETEPSIKDPHVPQHLSNDSTIRFDHVSFRYPHAEKDVLEDINFTASPGETIAIIGSTGSGKSTLVNLIPRFFDVTSGSITYGNIDIRNVTQHELRDHIGYIPQKGLLFSGTIESNLKYADENASQEQIDNALKISQAEEFVDRMPEGIHTEIAEGGTNVSGGQKQRLSIARALTKKAQIYIFDDTFSALDYATDARLRAALKEMIDETEATVFIVAQRISTIMHADKIIVLDEGKVAGMGTHEELLKTCRVYQEIALSQLSAEELGEEHE